MVIDSEFLTGLDVASTHIKNVIFDDPRVHVRITTVIHVLRAAAPDVAIEAPIGVECEEIVERAPPRAASFRDG